MTDRFALFQIRPKPAKIKASVERMLHDSMVSFTTQIRPKPTKIKASVERKLHDSLVSFTTQIVPNRQKSRRPWSGSSMILWLVMLARKRFRLGKSDDLDYLFRIGWVTPANRNESRGKKPNLTRRHGDAEKAEGKTARTPPYRHQSPPTAFSASPREQNSAWSPVLARKRFRLGKSDDQDYLFRIGWVTPANRNESRGKKPKLTRRHGDAEKAEGKNSKDSTVSSPISPHRVLR
ncbi:MAG: hypothetical protein NT142_08195, partial [Planctomycetota bacterium]|nr:hypothetical protein [Planctomycetota bacterium]